MRALSTHTEDVWLSGDYVGDERPIMRATIQKWHMFQTDYKVGPSTSTTWQHRGHFNSALFNQTGPVRELFNVKSFKWSRSVDQDAATATLVLYNVQWRKDIANPREEEFDFPGWYSPNRGGDNPWDYESNGWRNWLLPDRIIKTWEGYGVDQSVCPEDDDNMYASGVWVIDEVDMTVDGLITITMRDLGMLLLDQIMFPPVVPWGAYPLYWEAGDLVDAPSYLVPAGDWQSLEYEKDSNQFFESSTGGLYLDGIQDAVDPDDGSVHGHLGEDAFDGSPTTHFLSAGSADPGELSYVQGTMGSTDVSGVRVRFRGGPYTVYISLQQDGEWLGTNKIPFDAADDGPGMDAHIAYVKSLVWKTGDGATIDLPKTYTDITKIRITLKSRWNSGIGQERTYRGAIREVTYASATTLFDPGTKVPSGNYADYTDIIKWLCAWAGFHWPSDSTLKTVSDTRAKHNSGSPVLPKGAVWGDLMPVKTTGIVKLEESMWDKKPLRDGISSVQEITGFDFWIDESGGACWRLPNVFKKGNWLMPRDGGPNVDRTTEVTTIDERTTLIDLGVKLSSRNVRERIFVANANGQYGAVVQGYNPAKTGMHRVGGWTDSHFKSRIESRRMADLIAIRQSFLYRQNTITIAANPGIQIDDQVVLKERMTGEKYLHRVTGISSDFDYELGKWVYQLTTQWLGDEAFTDAAWRPKISHTTEQYLETLGAGSGSGGSGGSGGGGGGGGGEGGGDPPPDPTPDVPTSGDVRIGMSAPKANWSTRLSEVGASGITARRIFADLSSTGGNQKDVISAAHAAGMMPVVSYKVPSFTSAASGAYNAWAETAADYLDAFDKETAVTVWHEPNSDMTGAQFVAMHEEMMPIFKRGKLRVGPILNGFLLTQPSQPAGYNEFSTFSSATLLNLYDFFAIDAYQSGTITSPGSTMPVDKLLALYDWLDDQGHPNMSVGIGEYNGFSAAAISDIGEELLSNTDHNTFFGCVWNVAEARAGLLTGARLTAFQATKADGRAMH